MPYLILSLFAFSIITLIFFWARRQIAQTKKEMTTLFKSISYDLMEKNNQSFLDVAKVVLEKEKEGAKGELERKKEQISSLLSPIKETLDELKKHNLEIEKQRTGAYASLEKQIEHLAVSEKELRKETINLATALKSPNIRGAWGQVHLRRVVELAGMMNHCDFYEQVTKTGDDRVYRPDLVVRLPGNREIIIDAKTPLEAYLEAVDCKDEERRKIKLTQHAKQLRKHIKELSKKEYSKQFTHSPEYVILFLPAESFFSAALEIDPTLVEVGAVDNVIIATPTTLIAILRAVAYGWRQSSMSKSAEQIAAVGKELYERLLIMNGHFTKMGKALTHSVEAYNQAISSLESRVMVSAGRLKEMGVGSEKNEEKLELKPITQVTRSLEKAGLIE